MAKLEALSNLQLKFKCSLSLESMGLPAHLFKNKPKTAAFAFQVALVANCTGDSKLM